MQKDEKYFDSRVSHRYIKDGLLSQKEVDLHLKGLPDDKNQFDLIQIELQSEQDTFLDESELIK